MTPSVDPAEAARQLAEVDQSNAEIARRALAPWWYYPVSGLLTGSMLAMLAMPLFWRLVHLAFVLLAGWLMVRHYKHRTGVFVHTWRPGRTRWVSAGLAAMVLATGLISVAVWLYTGETWVHLVSAAIAAFMVTASGPLWEAAYRRDLETSSRP